VAQQCVCRPARRRRRGVVAGAGQPRSRFGHLGPRAAV